MMDRRRLLMSVAAGGALAVGPVRALASTALTQAAPKAATTAFHALLPTRCCCRTRNC